MSSSWTVEESNPSSAYARDFANAVNGKVLINVLQKNLLWFMAVGKLEPEALEYKCKRKEERFAVLQEARISSRVFFVAEVFKSE